jgi:UDP-N-acetylmuramyl pentapeptide phosphotransferase/UDP-N-acetylglucosamine-1-phosphate transferase
MATPEPVPVILDRIWRAMGRFGGDSRAGTAATLWRHQNPPVRFWIISMMLVLIGLSSLKLR